MVGKFAICSYLENMEQFARKFRDQPQNPLQKALYWVEYLLRNNATGGADFLTPQTRNVSSFIAHPVDVQLFLIVIFVLSVAVVLTVTVKLTVRRVLSKKLDSAKIKKKKN